ncbi:anhydro-N-acetylmuramic acid kinase [Rhizocola hellebori]|uniref:Anhydro-N-acetylmuramic acid kinase n=1 Tax=Rhizocola hellebori TaxID=1392758 RepID=A0A8J3VMI7_9ACTN|nr:anhydro-N-acetylmuramic acid kinase [Rhizocola hellebori]GIH11712.1 anhydro-N-acetylmuramic acid kinase [Rhizocola hellebori]
MRVLGMISGTSHDGIDVAVVDFALAGTTLHGSLRHAACIPYPPALRARLRAALPPASLTFAEVCTLDTLIGQAFADAASAALAVAGKVDLICSHGQTVYHWVEAGKVHGTLQLGQPAWIAERTGTPVVSDLRARDVAAGGQGAPLVALMDTLLLSGLPGRPAALNLGGIANLTIPTHPGAFPALAYDLGPANALIDAAAWRACGAHFDRDGELAAAGRIDPDLLAALLAEPYYALPPPKTTGKELFNLAYLESLLSQRNLAAVDVVATVTALTAEIVAAEVKRHGIDTVIASGGGCANPTLMAMVRSRLDGINVVTSGTLGVPSDAKEAIAFALLGYFTAHGLPGNIPSCTGAAAPRILGTITPGRAQLRIPAPPSEPPTRLLLA